MLTPPACQVPARSGFPSGVRAIGLVGALAGWASAVAKSSASASEMAWAKRAIGAFTVKPLIPNLAADRPGKLLRAIGKSNLPPGSGVGTVLRFIGCDGDQVPNLQRFPSEAGPLKRIRRIPFESPIGGIPAGVLHHDIEINVRFGPVAFRDDAVERNQLV